MSLHVYNTLERKKVPFIPRDEGKVSIYSCGITPYDSTHLGHARQYVLWDVFRRYLEWLGYEVTYVQNYTDVDDKIIAKAQAEGVSCQAVANRYIDEYVEVMDALGVRQADKYPRVTENIPEIIELVRSLEDRGLAYSSDGDVFFSVMAFPHYGRLSGRSADDMEAGARVEVDVRKRDPMDFALWKSAKPGEPAWESPWGMGRPGWHIECSAMAVKYLGAGFDMHGGGMDLIFPHHENEIAQAQGGTGMEFARYWLHHGFITVNAQKMSKSSGNFASVANMLTQFNPMAIRLYLLSMHYRNPMNFSTDEVAQAQKSLDRLAGAYNSLKKTAEVSAGEVSTSSTGVADGTALQEASERAMVMFRSAMDDDFNTALALAAIYDLAREVNRTAALPEVKKGAPVLRAHDAYRVMGELMGILGLADILSAREVDGGAARRDGSSDVKLLDGVLRMILEMRREAREAKNWALSDRIRDGLREAGIAVEDTQEGAKWRRLDD